MPPQAMNELYAIMAAGADNPNQVGMDYVQRMQYNDVLKSRNMADRNTMTDAQRPRPIGGGFLGATGGHINPVWDPAANGGKGGFRYEQGPNRMPQSIEVGGVKYFINPDVPLGQPGSMVPAVDMPTATDNASDLNRAKTLGTARGTDQAGAQVLGGEMQVLDARLNNLINHEDFAGGVGLLDQFTGKIGAQLGTDEGKITKEANYISNALTRSSVADWKGAISNAELNFFKDSVPQAGDGPDTWREWYNNYYVPTMQFVKMRARGEITESDSALSDFIDQHFNSGGSQLDSDTQALVDKYK